MTEDATTPPPAPEAPVDPASARIAALEARVDQIEAAFTDKFNSDEAIVGGLQSLVTRLQERVSKIAVSAPAPAPAAPAPTPPAAASVKACPSCGDPRALGKSACPGCGVPLSS